MQKKVYMNYTTLIVTIPQFKQEQDNLLQLVQVSKYPGLQTLLSKCGHQDFCEFRHNEYKERFLNSTTPILDL